MNDLFTIHARTIKGLESILSKELHDLGAKNIHTATGLVTFQGDKALLYQANLWCRTAIRIQKPLKSFQALDQETLYKEIRKIDWSKYLRPEGTLAVDTKVSSSFTSP